MVENLFMAFNITNYDTYLLLFLSSIFRVSIFFKLLFFLFQKYLMKSIGSIKLKLKNAIFYTFLSNFS